MNADLEAVARALGDRARPGVPLGPLTTYRVGGPAALLVDVEDHEDLGRLARTASGRDLEVLVLGKGSNLLVHDDGFPGLVLRLGESFATVEVDGTQVRAGGATPLPVLGRRTAAAGLTGLEWAVGVPGSVGGGIRMNAGGHGSDMAASVEGARLLDLRRGTDREVAAADLGLGYRRSAVGPDEVVVDARFRLEPGDAGRSEAEIAEIVRWRRRHQPGGQNAGSVFVNPEGDSAGRLIEASGCKGMRLGTASVSAKHANFIQADPGGRAGDVLDLMRAVRDRVLDRTGVRLVAETRLVGFEHDATRAVTA